jgi:predicted ArsR family transcriptional regulator
LKQTGFVQNLGRSRTRVLDELQAAGSSVGVADLARRVGLHPNTVRFHLDALAEAGLAARTVEPAARAGRPRVLYSATPDSAGAGRRSYRLLAEILAGHLAAHARRPAGTAVEAGREWGRSLARRPAPFQDVAAANAIGQLVDVLDDIGFLPELVTGGDDGGTQIRLRHCPFREIAAAHREVVCSVHLGLMQGLLADLHAPVTAARIRPFVTPSSCTVVLDPA